MRIHQTELYFAKSIEELEQQAKCFVDFKSLLNDAKACTTHCKRAFENIEVKIVKKDEEVAYVLCMQLETFLERALDITANVNCSWECYPHRKTLETILHNNLRKVKEICAPLKKSLASRYEERIARQHDARHAIRALFSELQSLSRNEQSFKDKSAWTPSTVHKGNQDNVVHAFEMQCTARPGSLTTQSSADLALAAQNDLASDLKAETYLGSSIADLERYFSVDDWTSLTSNNINTCITAGNRVLQEIDAAKVLGDEELQLVLNKLLAEYMQRSKAGASHNFTNDEQHDAYEDLYESYIDQAQRRCKLLEDSLKLRYAQKIALKVKSSHLMPSQSESRNYPERQPNSNASQLTLHILPEMSQPMQQHKDFQPDEKPYILSSQPSAELHSPFEAPIAQALDDIDIGSRTSPDRDVRKRADHALADVDSLAVLTSAASAVAADTDSVPVAAAFATAGVAGQETTSGSPATIVDTALALRGENNASEADPQCPSLSVVPGIVNRGYDCYMAAIVQILNNLPGFLEVINKMAEQGSHPLASELAAVLRRLKGGTVGDLQELKSVLGKLHDGEKWTSNIQQDAHEFFTHLLNMLEQNVEGAPAGEAESSRPTGERRCLAKEQIKFSVCDFFKCDKCGSESFENATMHYFPIYVSHAADEVQITQDILQKFIQTESVRYCCGTSCTKTTEVRSPPQVLILYIQRFAPRDEKDHEKGHKKLKTAIKFPTENLDFRPLMPRASEASNYGVYRLTGIVNHVGDDLESGHYTAHCKNLNDGLWYLFSDATVTQCPVANASATDAYILFYTNCSPTTTEDQA